MLIVDPRRDQIRREARERLGVRTPGRRERPFANAIKLGLAEESPRVPEDSRAVLERAGLWLGPLAPQHAWHAWILEQVSVTTLKIERVGRIDRRRRDLAALRAETSWDVDRRLDAEVIGLALSDQPAVVVEKLRQTLQGCEWLMDRWAMLAHAADVQGNSWDEAQRSLAFDLLGTPAELRKLDLYGSTIDGEGRALGEAEPLASAARCQVDVLATLRDALADADALAQHLAASDLVDPDTPEDRRQQGREQALYSRLKWLHRQLCTETPGKDPSPRLLEYFKIEPESQATAPAAKGQSSAPSKTAEAAQSPGNGRQVITDAGWELVPRAEARMKKAEARRKAAERRRERRRG